MQDALPHGRRKRLVYVCQHPRAQLAPVPPNLRHHRINAVRRGPGHQANDELGGVFGLALNLHGPRLEKPATANKSYLALAGHSFAFAPLVCCIDGLTRPMAKCPCHRKVK